HRADGRVALADLWADFDGDAHGRRVVEDEAHEGVPDGPGHPVRYEEVDPGEVRERNLTLLVVRGEIVRRAIVEIAHTGQAYVVAVDDRPRHHGDLGLPLAVLGRRDGEEPRDDAEE